MWWSGLYVSHYTGDSFSRFVTNRSLSFSSGPTKCASPYKCTYSNGNLLSSLSHMVLALIATSFLSLLLSMLVKCLLGLRRRRTAQWIGTVSLKTDSICLLYIPSYIKWQTQPFIEIRTASWAALHRRSFKDARLNESKTPRRYICIWRKKSSTPW